jgi:hypothetical protein
MSQAPHVEKIIVRFWQRRLFYFACAATTIVLGLASRRFGASQPAFIAEFAGDTLWALMVFLGVSVVAPSARLSSRGTVALAFACGIELSQLHHALWIDTIRQTTLGGLILGFGFLWSDLLCYTAGVAIGVILDYWIVLKLFVVRQPIV